jgi:hypothetical protein
MTYDLSWTVPFLVVLSLLALAGAIVSLTLMGQLGARHHRARVGRHESIPTYYRRVVLAH